MSVCFTPRETNHLNAHILTLRFDADLREYWERVSPLWTDLYHIWQDIGFDDETIRVRNSFAGKYYLVRADTTLLIRFLFFCCQLNTNLTFEFQNLSKDIKNGEVELYHEIKQALEASKAGAEALLVVPERGVTCSTPRPAPAAVTATTTYAQLAWQAHLAERRSSGTIKINAAPT